MAYAGWIAGCLGVLVLAGLTERWLRDRAWMAVPVRIHVNGTRGKSTVTRLIWAALREAGIPAVARCTGTAARILHPDGTERTWRRCGRANIREELRLLLLARRLGARALVAECMAIQPDLQWTTERQMIRATVGIITNVRTDHTEVMGGALEEIAGCLANTVPRASTLILGTDDFESLFKERARLLGTRVAVAKASDSGEIEPNLATPAWLVDDRRIALAVTRELGIPDATALAGMSRFPPDSGAARSGELRSRGGCVHYLDAAAANDPESLELLAAEWRKSPAVGLSSDTIIVYNHRKDRPARLLRFYSKMACIAGASEVWVTGDRPAYLLWRSLRRSTAIGGPRFVSVDRLKHALEQLPAPITAVIFCGNTRGLDLSPIIETGSHG